MEFHKEVASKLGPALEILVEEVQYGRVSLTGLRKIALKLHPHVNGTFQQYEHKEESYENILRYMLDTWWKKQLHKDDIDGVKILMTALNDANLEYLAYKIDPLNLPQHMSEEFERTVSSPARENFQPSLYNEPEVRVGSGSFGIVYRVNKKHEGINGLPSEVAIKIIKDPSKEYANTEFKLQSYIKFEHANIVKYFAFVEKKQPPINPVWIYMEFCESDFSKLFELYKKKNETFTDIEICHLSLGTAKGVQYLHGQSLIHRDIKPSNILVSCPPGEQAIRNMTPKLSDFNISKLSNYEAGSKDETNTRGIGTRYYKAPEVMKEHKGYHSAKYGMKADVFSFGAVYYEMLKLEALITDDNQIMQNVNSKLGTMADGSHRDILNGCLKEKTDERFSIDQVIEKIA